MDQFELDKAIGMGKLLIAIFGAPPKGKFALILLEEYEKKSERLKKVLETLTYRERMVIELLYGCGDGNVYTVAEVGRIFKINPDRVRQIHKKAILRLQHPVRSRHLEKFLWI